MPITGITINAVEPFAEAKGFGEAGGYVRVHGIAQGVLDLSLLELADQVHVDLPFSGRPAFHAEPS